LRRRRARSAISPRWPLTRRAKHWQNGIIDRSWCCPRGRSPARVFRS